MIRSWPGTVVRYRDYCTVVRCRDYWFIMRCVEIICVVIFICRGSALYIAPAGRLLGAYDIGVATPRAVVHASDKTSGDARSWYMISGDAKSWSKAAEAVERRNEMLKRPNFGLCFTFVNKLSKKRSVSVFGVSAESMQCSYDSRGNNVPIILLLIQERLYAQGGLKFGHDLIRENPLVGLQKSLQSAVHILLLQKLNGSRLLQTAVFKGCMCMPAAVFRGV
ncbi:hypothetical protein Tco_0995076 [Tanacetum coccineum]